MSGWQYTPGTGPYTYARPQVRATGGIRTSRTELTHLTIAAIVLTVDIAIITTRFVSFFGVAAYASVGVILDALAVGAISALTGFLFHELAHKIVAERRGFWAEFRMSPQGLLISFVTALLGFLFAAPGATMVQGMYDRRDWGLTSLAGPTLNLAEGLAFFAGAFAVFHLNGSFVLYSFLIFLAFFNGWFATFNLLPFGPLDGRKVMGWSTPVWVLAFAGSVIFLAAAGLVSYGYLSF